jgi:PRTRC genetic system ThiF family protein
MTHAPTIAVVGCGGTGGFVAEGICRLLIGNNLPIMLVDPDRVEPHNLLRQNFFQEDVGKFKAQALAERLSRKYGRVIGYSVWPFDREMFDRPMEAAGLISKALSLFIIGCVDNAQARKDISEAIGKANFSNNWWLDSGNDHHSGQVLIGNAAKIGDLQESFDEEMHTVDTLPAPSLQLPALLIPPNKPEDPVDCAEAVMNEDQSPTINQAMATLVLDIFYRFLKGTLTWMAEYIDLDAGSLQTVPADPNMIARKFSIKQELLMKAGCHIGRMGHTRHLTEAEL